MTKEDAKKRIDGIKTQIEKEKKSLDQLKQKHVRLVEHAKQGIDQCKSPSIKIQYKTAFDKLKVNNSKELETQKKKIDKMKEEIDKIKSQVK